MDFSLTGNILEDMCDADLLRSTDLILQSANFSQ